MPEGAATAPSPPFQDGFVVIIVFKQPFFIDVFDGFLVIVFKQLVIVDIALEFLFAFGIYFFIIQVFHSFPSHKKHPNPANRNQAKSIADVSKGSLPFCQRPNSTHNRLNNHQNF